MRRLRYFFTSVGSQLSKLEKMSENKFSILLVEAVEKRKFLYDSNDTDYSRREKVEKAWKEISNEIKEEEQKEHAEKVINSEKQELNKFRKYAQERIERFLNDDRKFIEFPPLEHRIYRTIIHDVAEVAGLVGMSFGTEGVDRYTVVYKKEHLPTVDELNARRNGGVEEKPKESQESSTEKKLEDIEKIIPTTNYKDKYAHLIGSGITLEAAGTGDSDRNYGFVPSKNKKDIRSIEQTMADIQAKKKLKKTNET